ncbi:hypothetical protein [Pontibacter anaerobius]|uniref:Uncharacterized protein n=1 Tax=Pontibacter anaerobius TaxID=2993940 RepID=A0ABT3RDD5_9BACT|nr:hypothetical protein [Pontibacter anaerobius]MCX2739560.1 hypothetical protein [Pontibacter anaerobius]
MNKRFFPIAAVAVLLSVSSCSYDKTGTSFEVVDANEDESVNPAHIRGYGNREPGTTAPGGPKPNQYYAFNITTLPTATRQQLEGKVAVEMVTAYYAPNRQLSDLAEQYNPSAAGSQKDTTASPAPSGTTSGDADTSTDTGNEQN